MNIAPSSRESESVHTTDRKHTVLLADDETGVRTILTFLLRKNGFRVFTAQDGLEAIELFKAHPNEIGVVLLDVNMPLLSGPIAAESIRQMAPDVRVVLTSGMERQEVARRYSIEPPWTFLPKPFDFHAVESLFTAA